MSLVVAGGVYLERCLTPWRLSLLGSGGRAAAAVSRLSPGTLLHTFHPQDAAADAVLALAGFGVETICHPSHAVMAFDYLHPLSEPRIRPVPPPSSGTIAVAGDVVLRFGCLEGDFQVDARRAIYDPQSGAAPAFFGANGSSARDLAIVLNQHEASLLVGTDDPAAAAVALREREGATSVVVKMGSAGAHVLEGASSATVPAYRSLAVDKIGSGDVFSAAFAHLWGECGMAGAEAAERASRYVAGYVEDRLLPLEKEPRAGMEAITSSPGTRIYLGGPFFTTPQLWAVEEARAGLRALGAEVFSPLHDVGFGPPAQVARRDLDGLITCSAMLALLNEPDPGTLFEVGHARSRGIPVVAFVQQAREQDITMLEGTGCEIVDDFASALYRVMWAAEA